MRRARPLLGTIVEIAGDAGGGPAIDAAFAAVAEVHRLMSFHDRTSDVGRLNRDAGAGPLAVHPWTFRVLQTAADLHRESSGAFDVAVAPALQRIGLLPGDDGGGQGAFAPSTADAIELLPGCRVRFRRPGVRIDLGGIAKGFAVDCAIDTLRRHGVRRGLVNAGGDLAAFGPPSQPVHIRDPRDPRRLIGRIDLADMAIASSGGRFDPFRTAMAGDSAVIDPATQAPAGAIAGATVMAPTCMLADALTKIVMIAPGRVGDLLAHYRAHALVVSTDGEVRISPGWSDCVSRAA